MRLVKVGPVAGRLAYSAASGGILIATEMTIPLTPYVRARIDDGDLVEFEMTAGPAEKLGKTTQEGK
jgi:hypothetical protein